jgi:eukaryotic-like serine/threonine-protein kinase
MDSSTFDEAAIFDAARRIEATDARHRYLEGACAGDFALQTRLEALLLIDQADRGFLERPAEGVTAPAVGGISEAPGERIGPYKLVQAIGEGGMGTVWMAEQREPVKRLVALKLIKPGMDSRAVLARFEAERQALALMDHPNIAKILDGGTTRDEPGGVGPGRPYFVMELVKGRPLTEYCDARRLSIKDRIDLFVQICSAVQHAHQKGIIHRDLKPSNVLVTEHDGEPVPMVIDFGLAKALNAVDSLTDRTLCTAFGTIVGTPLYMAPEQVGITALDVDTRIDIYALGVILYELLTGTTPLSKQRLKQAAWEEIRRVIREEEPPRPSLRLSSSDDILPTVAASRQTEPLKLTRMVRGDLDWIVMKALEKDRTRRYETASGLARDLQRYLASEPVLARPPSTAYRLGKFAQRHRAAVLAGAAVLAALLAGTLVAGWQAVVATRAKQHALDAAATALMKEAETRAVLDFVETKVFAAARPKGQAGGLGTSVTVRQAVEAALPFVANRFAEQPITEARLRMTMGMSFQYVGELKIAAEQFQIARALYVRHRGLDDPDTLNSMNWLAENYRQSGRHTEALQLQQETLARRKTLLGPDHPDSLFSMNNLAICYWALGQTAEALQLQAETLARRQARLGMDHPDTLASMNNLATCYSVLGRHADSLPLHQKTLALMKTKLGPDHPDTLMSMHNGAAVLAVLGRYAEAVGLLEETRTRRREQLGPDHPETLQTQINLAFCYRSLGQHAEARQIIEQTLALQKARLAPDHPDTLASMQELACIRFALGEHSEALNLYEDALAKRKAKVGAGHPDVLSCIREMAGLRLHHFQKTGDAAGCREMTEMCEKLQPADPASCYEAACYRAVTAAVVCAGGKPSNAKEAEAEADRSMAWLKQAVASGYTDAAHMKEDKDLDALRTRGDFKKLLAELESRK